MTTSEPAHQAHCVDHQPDSSDRAASKTNGGSKDEAGVAAGEAHRMKHHKRMAAARRAGTVGMMHHNNGSRGGCTNGGDEYCLSVSSGLGQSSDIHSYWHARRRGMLMMAGVAVLC